MSETEIFNASFVQDTEVSDAVLNKTVADLLSWLDSTPGLLECSDPVLHTPAAEIHPRLFTENPDLLKKCAQVLINQLMAVKAVGIAAPQMGLPYAMMVVPTKDDATEFLVAINPKISVTNANTPKALGVEGCLSYPFFKVDVLRANEIQAEFTDLVGNRREARIDGFTSRVWQHEYDHLLGVTMEDRVPSVRWQYAVEDAEKRKKKMMKKINQLNKIKGDEQ